MLIFIAPYHFNACSMDPKMNEKISELIERITYLYDEENVDQAYDKAMLIKVDLLRLLSEEKSVMQAVGILEKYGYRQCEALKEQIIEDFKNNVLNQLRRVIAGSAKLTFDKKTLFRFENQDTSNMPVDWNSPKFHYRK
jgi:hypothetical protein